MGAQSRGRDRSSAADGFESPAGRLRRVVVTLSLPGKEALEHLSAGPNRPDKLAMLFDEEYTRFICALSSLPTDPQLRALQALDAELNAMSDPENATLWTESAFREHPQWEWVRSLAQQAVDAFDW